MESFGGPGMVAVGNGIRKKRSDASRRPRHDSHSLLQSNIIALPGSTQLLKDPSNEDEDKAVVVSNGISKLKKLKLKVGGVTRTIHTKRDGDFAYESSSSVAFKLQEKPILQDEIDTKRKGFGIKFKNIPRPDSTSQTEQVRKSNRIPKRRVLDIGFDEDEGHRNEEIRYLEPSTFKVPKIRVVSDVMYDGAVGIKTRSEDMDYVEEVEISDEEHESSRKKMKRVVYPNESTPTTRSMQSISGSIDYSNLLSFNSKKKKEKLSELEQQLKKTEAAQRRKIQSEKAAREAEAEAIRRILGQDSVRKKKEEKMKKQRDELLQERAANAHTLSANTVRWVNGPTGTIVTFSEDIGLPTIFNHAPCSYPPPREKCAGPNCTNAYKYRDAKSNLPLCSLQCYKSIDRNVQPLAAR